MPHILPARACSSITRVEAHHARTKAEWVQQPSDAFRISFNQIDRHIIKPCRVSLTHLLEDGSKLLNQGDETEVILDQRQDHLVLRQPGLLFAGNRSREEVCKVLLPPLPLAQGGVSSASA